jgi:multidrug resistance efflux pump
MPRKIYERDCRARLDHAEADFDQAMHSYRELASKLAAMEAERDAWKAAARPPLDSP